MREITTYEVNVVSGGEMPLKAYPYTMLTFAVMGGVCGLCFEDNTLAAVGAVAGALVALPIVGMFDPTFHAAWQTAFLPEL